MRGVVFDLDDTLYLERDYVRSGFQAVAGIVSREMGHAPGEIFESLCGMFERGVRGDTFDRLLQEYPRIASRYDSRSRTRNRVASRRRRDPRRASRPRYPVRNHHRRATNQPAKETRSAAARSASHRPRDLDGRLGKRLLEAPSQGVPGDCDRVGGGLERTGLRGGQSGEGLSCPPETGMANDPHPVSRPGAFWGGKSLGGTRGGYGG